MALTLFEILGTFRVDKAAGIASMQGLEAQGASTAAKLNASMKKTGDFMAKTIKLGAVAATAAIAGFTVSSAKEFLGFQKSMSEVFTLMPGLSKSAKDQMSADVLELAETIGILPEELIPALYQAISAGVPPDNVFSFLETAGKLAIGGVTDIQTAIDGLTSVVNSYGKENISAAHAANVMFTAVKLGKTTVEEFSSRLFQAVPIASALGINFEQIAGALAQMTLQGVPTRVAMTQLKYLMQEVSTAGTEVNTIFTDLVETSFTDFIEKGGDLSDVLEILQEYAEANNVSIKDLFSSIEAGSAALNLSGGNLDQFRAKIDAMADSAGASDAAFAEMADSIQHKIDELSAWWSSTKITIGADMEDDLSQLLDFLDAHKDEIANTLSSLVTGFINLLKWLIDNRAAVGAALGTLAVGLGAILAYTHPLLVGIMALSAGIAYFYAEHKKAVEAAEETAKALREMEQATNAAQEAAEKTADALGDLRKAGQAVTENLRAGGDAAVGTKQELFDMAGVVTDLSDKLHGLETALNEALGVDYRESEWKGVFDQMNQDIFDAVQSARAAGGDWEKVAIQNVNNVLTSYATAYPEIEDQLRSYVISLDEVTEATIRTSKAQGLAFTEGGEYDELLSRISRARELIKKAFADVETEVQKKGGPAVSFVKPFADAVDGLKNKLPAAEAVIAQFGGSIADLTDEEKAQLEAAQETRDGVVQAWKDSTDTIAAVYGGFLDDLADMRQHNLDLEKSHADNVKQINADSTADLKKLSDDRIKSLADLQAALTAGDISYQEYSDSVQKVTKEYNDATLQASQDRQQALADEEQAYEDAKVSIWDILKEMMHNIWVAVREELTLQAAKALALGAAALLNPLTWATAPGYFLQAASLGAAAAGLALSGFKKGGIATEPTVALLGDAGVPEPVIPLTQENLAMIGAGVARAMGVTRVGSPSESSAATSLTVNFNNPVVRSDQDIRRLSAEMTEALKTWERGRGIVRLE